MATKNKSKGRRNGYMAQDPPEFVNRVRFNHGFHDATADVENGTPRTLTETGDHGIHQVSRRFSRFYFEGYRAGLAEMTTALVRPASSEPAWVAFLASLRAQGQAVMTVIGVYED